jgi:hypothetical protein
MKVKSRIKSGVLIHNHNQTGIRIKSRVKSGAVSTNHNQTR